MSDQDDQQPVKRVEMPGQALHQNEGEYCIHFSGMAWGTCHAGIAYKSVAVAVPEEQVRAGAPRTLRPCLEWHHVASACPSCQYPDAEERARNEAERVASITQLVKDLTGHQCIVCHQPMTGTYRMGRCTYSQPCGHRQGQRP